MILIILQIIFFCIFLINIISFWYIQKYGDISIENILFHLSVPLKNAPTEIFNGISLYIFSAVCIFIIFIVYVRPNKKQLVVSCMLLLALGLFYINKHFQVIEFLKNQLDASRFIEQNYVYPKENIIQFPQNKKNLIVIQVESLESSYQDKENGGLFDKNYIPELTDLANKNVSFSHSSKIEGAAVLPKSGWTIAAVVSETAGIPLKLFGHTYLNNKFNKIEIDNNMDKYQYFLPGAITLGDILKKEGYQNYFFLGTDKEFAGQGLYFQEHGNYIIFDMNSIQKTETNIPATDNDLFQFVKEKLLTKINQKEPRHIFIQTYDTHFAPKEKFSEISSNLNTFLNWLKLQSYFKNTVIVIIGDHCNMHQNDFYGIEGTEFRYVGNTMRKIYNVFINPHVKVIQEKNRTFSTVDFFPTILASLGVKINGNKLGLGTNLFSQEQTLLEKYDIDFVFQEISKKSHFYNKKLLSK